MCRSEHEKNRRRDLITALRNRREQMQLSLKRDHSQQNRYLATEYQHVAVMNAASNTGRLYCISVECKCKCRSALLQQSGHSSSPARETDRTAELDNQGILQMQQDVMQEQDQNLMAMEQSVASTRVCEPAL